MEKTVTAVLVAVNRERDPRPVCERALAFASLPPGNDPAGAV